MLFTLLETLNGILIVRQRIFLFQVELKLEDDRSVDGLIYWPHPETKPEHFQDPHVIEIMAPKIPELSLGDKVTFLVNKSQMRFYK